MVEDGAAGTGGGGSPVAGRAVVPVFLVSVARSGSTLLRYLLDTHPDVTCPPELNLSGMMKEVGAVWNRVLDAFGAPSPDDPLARKEVLRQVRVVADTIMTTMAEQAGAYVFCDKSLTTVNDLNLVSRCYPNASYIFLYRFPLDMIASGIEAQKWGYHSYGFGPYIRRNPANFMSGLADYWIERTTRMLEFESSCESPHIRVHYEKLCDDPDGELARLLEFLGLPADDSIVARALSIPHQTGMADYKVDFRRTVGSESIGRGALLPRLLTKQQSERIEEMLIDLEYPSLEDGWRGGLSELLQLKGSPKTTPLGDDVVNQIVKVIAERASDPASDAAFEHAPFEIVVHSRGRAIAIAVAADRSVELREHFEEPVPTNAVLGAQAEEAPVAVEDLAPVPLQFICKDDVLVDIVAGELSLADAINDLRVRIVGAGNPATVRGRGDNRKLFAAVGALLAPELS
jgi:hypothetical protein